MNILVTGANGWIGKAVSLALLRKGHVVHGLVRRSGGSANGVREWIHTPADFETLNVGKLVGLHFDAIVHTAARAHVMDEREADPWRIYRATNVVGTQRLADAAHQVGIQRFVFLSSIKALGEREPGRPWRENDGPLTIKGLDPYGRSKFEAEQALLNMADATFKVIIIRPPLVYGPGVRANFLKLIQLIDRGWPLPLGCVQAERGMVALDNLVDAISHCVTAPDHSLATQNIFHVADETALPVCDLIVKLAGLLGKKSMLLPVPVSWLQGLGKLTGRNQQIDRLTQPLRMETSTIRSVLGWSPPLSTDEGLKQTINWYLSTRK